MVRAGQQWANCFALFHDRNAFLYTEIVVWGPSDFLFCRTTTKMKSNMKMNMQNQRKDDAEHEEEQLLKYDIVGVKLHHILYQNMCTKIRRGLKSM